MNAIVIEQSQEQTRLAFEVHRNAEISRIRLARAKVSSTLSDEGPGRPVGVKFKFKSRRLDGPSGVLRLEIVFRLTGTEARDEEDGGGSEQLPAKGKQEPVLSVECAYEADYEVAEGFAITPEHVESFKDGNAIFNAWPYFREYLQSSLVRMGLPALTAPFLRLEPKLRGKTRA